MYPHAVKMEYAEGLSLWIDDDLNEGDVSITVELESNGGPGEPQITFKRGRREGVLNMNAVNR